MVVAAHHAGVGSHVRESNQSKPQHCSGGVMCCGIWMGVVVSQRWGAAARGKGIPSTATAPPGRTTASKPASATRDWSAPGSTMAWSNDPAGLRDGCNDVGPWAGMVAEASGLNGASSAGITSCSS